MYIRAVKFVNFEKWNFTKNTGFRYLVLNYIKTLFQMCFKKRELVIFCSMRLRREAKSLSTKKKSLLNSNIDNILLQNSNFVF